MFRRLREAIGSIVDKLTTTKLDEKSLDPILDELKISLVRCDVSLPIAEEICSELKRELAGRQIGRLEDKRRLVRDALRRLLLQFLSYEVTDLIDLVKSKRGAKRPAVILFLGFNGTGKTTSLAKVTKLLLNEGFSVVLACSDTHRAGAIEQLEIHAERLNVPMVKKPYGSDSASVAYDAIAYAKSKGIDAVLIDTAGRPEADLNLMEDLRKVRCTANPDLSILVLDALAGHAAVEQALEFNQHVGVDAIIMAKVDADAKGGSSISASYAIKKPILFVGTGQRYGDLVKFDPQVFVSTIVG